MIDFLADNIGTIVTALVVLAVVALVIFVMIRDKRAGKSSCGCGCEHCQNAKYCHGSKKVNHT